MPACGLTYERENLSMKEKISGKTKTFALIGSPVGHSGSPGIYNYCFETMGFDNVYVALDVSLERLSDAMAGIKAMGFSGINVTMPCKSAVIEYLDEISPAARFMNACNVAVNKDGRWIGDNTDGAGFVNNLKSQGVDVAGKTMSIIGAGGAGTAVAVQSALSGASKIFVFNLKDEFFVRAENTACKICESLPACKFEVYDLSDEKALKKAVSESDILVNTTRSGMAPNTDEMPVPSEGIFREGLVVCDTIYNPKETKLLSEAKKSGCVTVDGTGMLIYQAAAAFKLFTGAEMPVEEVRNLMFG